MFEELVGTQNLEELGKALKSTPTLSPQDFEAGYLIAIREGWLDGVVMFLDHGADPNLRTSFGELPLHIAVEEDRAEIVRALLNRGAQVDCRDFGGWTPLHCAVDLEGVVGTQSMSPPVMSVSVPLLSHHANPYLRTPHGKSAVDIARQYGHKEFLAAVEKQDTRTIDQ